MLERRKIDLNEKHRTIKLWITIMGIGFVLVGFIAAGAVKINQVDRNKGDIEVIEVEQREQRDILIRIDENVKGIKEDITELKNRQ